MSSFGIRELLLARSVPLGRDETFDRLVTKLSELGFEIVRQDRTNFEIVAHGFCLLNSRILWRSYADKLFIQLIESEGRTRVEVFAIPNVLTQKTERRRYALRRTDRLRLVEGHPAPLTLSRSAPIVMF
jgi:hypothetical protein